MNRFKPHERREIEVFKDIFAAVEDYLPIDFTIEVFRHMRDNPKGFDIEWVRRGVITARRIAQGHNLSASDTCVLVASIMLLESGRKFMGVGKREGAMAFGISLLNKTIPGFFTDDEFRAISYCLRYNRERSRLTSAGVLVILVNEVSLLLDIVHQDLPGAVVAYVKDNEICLKPKDSGQNGTEAWQADAVLNLRNRFGTNGTLWTEITPTTKDIFRFEINAIQNMAGGDSYMTDLFTQNLKRMFS